MRKTLMVLFAIVSIGFVSPAVASARHGFHGGRAISWGGPWGSNYRWDGPDWGVGYGYIPYYGDGGCYLVWQRFWDGYGWLSRSVQDCG
jgi:hypothetical protein